VKFDPPSDLPENLHRVERQGDSVLGVYVSIRQKSLRTCNDDAIAARLCFRASTLRGGLAPRTFRHFYIARGQRVVMEQHKMRDYVRIIDRDACGW